ncbi:hypothetical protein C0J08_06460 [Marinomonas sp. CT5]|nr:hypothetical protein C0J08_06460 [Marinomonas sp. CT5]
MRVIPFIHSALFLLYESLFIDIRGLSYLPPAQNEHNWFYLKWLNAQESDHLKNKLYIYPLIAFWFSP